MRKRIYLAAIAECEMPGRSTRALQGQAADVPTYRKRPRSGPMQQKVKRSAVNIVLQKKPIGALLPFGRFATQTATEDRLDDNQIQIAKITTRRQPRFLTLLTPGFKREDAIINDRIK